MTHGIPAGLSRMFWAVARVHPGFERKALKELLEAGFEGYAPRFKSVTVRRGRRIARICWLFPSYVMVRICEGWQQLRRLRSVRQVLMVGDCLAKVPNKVVNDLKSREVQGLIRLERGRRVGDSVTIKRGPLQFQTGIYQGMSTRDRVFVLLNALGRVELAAADLDEG